MRTDNILNTILINQSVLTRKSLRDRVSLLLKSVAGLLVFFLLLRPDWLPQWVYWGLLAVSVALTLWEMLNDYRRRRPRHRWRDIGLVLFSLSVVWIVIMPPVLYYGSPDEKDMAYATVGMGLLTLCASVGCLLRWRRLRVRAEMRLWELRTERRKRASLRARAEVEGGVS